MLRKSTAASVGVIALIIAVTAAVLFFAFNAGKASPQSLEELVPILATPQGEVDALPKVIQQGEGSRVLDEQTSRYIGSDGKAQFFVALNDSSELCLISYLPENGGAAGNTCVAAEQFAEHGIGGGIGSGSVYAEAYLLPSDVDPVAVRQGKPLPSGAEVEFKTDHLIIVVPGEGAPPSIELEKTNGNPFSFWPMA